MLVLRNISHENDIEIVTNCLFGFGELINREAINRTYIYKFVKFLFLKTEYILIRGLVNGLPLGEFTLKVVISLINFI